MCNDDTWNEDDRGYAWSHGWDVFSLDNGMLQIQALDEPEEVCADAGIESVQRFDGSYRDFMATADVYTRAGRDKNWHCLKAIRLVECAARDAFDTLCKLEDYTDAND
jgi:hypothetical protein